MLNVPRSAAPDVRAHCLGCYDDEDPTLVGREIVLMFRHRRRVTARVLPGLVIVGLGVLLVLNNLDVYPLGGLERYWPLLLVAFGIHRVFDPARRGRGLGAVVLVAGIWLQLSKLDLLSFHLADLKLYMAFDSRRDRTLSTHGHPPARVGCIIGPWRCSCRDIVPTCQFRDCPPRRVASVAAIADCLGDWDGLQGDAREGLAALAGYGSRVGGSAREAKIMKVQFYQKPT